MNNLKLDLKRITLICIDGRVIDEEKLERYRLIVDYMVKRVDFHRIIFVAMSNPNIEGVDFIKTDRMSINDYSSFCVKRLNDHIDSDFCMIFQDDGFILNPELWEDSFLDYDYIGAPWPFTLGWPVEGRQVGNGGFSLRSKKFLQISSELPDTRENEDTYILCANRDYLDSNNIRIAPLDIARKFAVEVPLDDEHNINNCFGYHAKHLVNQAIEYIKQKNISEE